MTLVLALLLAPEWSTRGDESAQLQAIVGNQAFDFVTWEVNTLFDKASMALRGDARYLSADAQRETVLGFLDDVAQARLVEAALERAYAEGDQAEAERLSAEWSALRSAMAETQPLAEAILEQQVSSVLADESFDIVGRTWPPVSATMTPLPSMLILSPRDEIRRLYSVPLRHDLSVTEKEQLEATARDELGYAALVVSIGGLGIFPAMVYESANLNWLVETFAHEWAHHWLTFKPLGAQFLLPISSIAPEVWTMNETTASIVGTEVGREVMARYYPDLVPPAVAESDAGADSAESTPPPFDFRAEMRETRETVDVLLADGAIDEAEAYMEQRRLLFVENGYIMRKLNQAYFAFHGAYADEPGATGGDPVGPLVLEVRDSSASLRDFLDAMAPLTSFAELEATVAGSRR